VVEHHVMVLRKFWRGSLIFSVFMPVAYLAAMGLGIGSLVDGAQRQQLVGGVSYLEFVAPGLLAASIMQVATGDNMWPVMGGLKWQKTWHAMLNTPLRVSDLVAGQFVYTALRMGIGGLGYMLALVAFGVVRSWWALLALPAGVLCGLAFATPTAAYTATQESEQGFIVLFRIVVMPLFLFSGAFFPIEQLPGWLAALARVTPLWHGIELVRGLVLGTLDVNRVPLHVGYLCLWAAVGWAVAVKTFERRLSP
jgi:lipooligosaccharide transport system permease protein